MPDSAHVFMENVFHLTGYLHRLLFLMKELDIKEHEISKTIEEKEELYLENLNYIHKQTIKKQSIHSQNDTHSEYLDKNDHSINQQLVDENDHEISNNNMNTHMDTFSKREENLKLEISPDDNKINNDFETEYVNNEKLTKCIKTENDEKHIKETEETSFSSEQLKEKNIPSQSDNPNDELKNINKILTDDQMETDMMVHNIDDNLDKYDNIKNWNTKEEDEDSDDRKPELLFNEDELNEYLNIITNDRESCMALLREKICINNQISYMIKSYYEKLKKQYDKLYIEMEMNGETPPNIYNTNKNKNEYPDFDDNVNINNNINVMNNTTTSGRNKGNYANSAVGASSVANYTNENYQYDAYDFECTKEDDNEILNKMNNRKHSVKYDEDYNPYNSEKSKKSKKAKRNRSDSAHSNKLSKNNSAKSSQNIGTSKNVNPIENKPNKMRITIGSLADSHLKNNETLKINKDNKPEKTENKDPEDLLFNDGINGDDHISEQDDKNDEKKNEKNTHKNKKAQK
ncbi:conserved Plasmodium protein, unknown function [Plasmodium vinckei vinckei]|uniref:Inhibitor of growth protein N-terminal histone-binding domain-containing protein n=1 Tax=Plasmodium vinckei vinckei TaxID=54757 RepID=A0A081IBV7_PLAVN|nr:conserved Plasmodium protein, unknown function [Plasmodium vinckei vinckei]KEG01165.1 hypothetical protein YYE_03753 [Plasmodium vinckei vinckei]VEV55138.1 conserved Plasmodium protein, unknown function [Plasmodium vinckei vinckei]